MRRSVPWLDEQRLCFIYLIASNHCVGDVIELYFTGYYMTCADLRAPHCEHLTPGF